MKRLMLLGLLLGLSAEGWSESYSRKDTMNVSQDDGDTIATTQVSVGVCPGTSCPTLLSAAVTNRGLRRRVIQNSSAFKVYIGSNTTTLSTTGYVIGESTSTSIFSQLETHSTAAIYATAQSTGTVSVLTETNATP